MGLVLVDTDGSCGVSRAGLGQQLVVTGSREVPLEWGDDVLVRRRR
jgi:hypothetical protein